MSSSLFAARDLACPVCSQSFVLHTPKSNAGVLERRDADFCPYFQGPNPIFYAVWVCPHCGFAAYKEDFRNLPDRDRLALRMLLEDGADHRRHDFSQQERTIFAAMLSFKLALRCYLARKAEFEILGGLTMRLAWMCRHGHDRRREQLHLGEACQYYQQAFDRGLARGSQTTMAAVAYLVGECHRRLGRGQEAISWYLRAIQEDRGKGEIFTKARDQMYEAREGIRFFELLRGVAILRPLEIQEIALLSVQIRSQALGVGKVLVRQGEPGSSMYLLVQGRARAEIDGRKVGELGPGEVTGEMSLLTGRPRTATVVANEAATVLEIDRIAFKTVLQSNPAIALEIARIVAERRARNDVAVLEELPEASDVADASGASGASGILNRLRTVFEIA